MRNGFVCLLFEAFEVGFVFVCAHQIVGFFKIADFDEPCIVWRFVDLFWGIEELFVDFSNGAAHRREHVADSLNGFNICKGFTSFDFVVDFWQINEYEVAKFALCVVSDADNGNVAIDEYPFMIFGITQFFSDFPLKYILSYILKRC